MIEFPALVKLDGDHELLFVATRQALHTDAALQGLIASDQDWLIDSKGHGFGLNTLLEHSSLEADEAKFAVKKRFTLDDVICLIREHEFSQCRVCLAKISFPDIRAAVASLAFEYP